MKSAPLILISPSTERAGVEFGDWSLSLSNRYSDAVIAAGGLPCVFPATTSRKVMAEAVRRCDGVLLTGGDDIDPKLYAKKLPGKLAKTVGPTDPERDIWEKGLLKEIFKQRKPLLAICRGHQMLNVALGGELIVDIPTQVTGALNHNRMDRKTRPVHDVTVEPDSALARITGKKTIGVNSTHHQAIGKLAAPLRIVAKSKDGVVEAVELKNPAKQPFLLGVQFHPERMIDEDAIFLGLFKSFVDSCQRPTK